MTFVSRMGKKLGFFLFCFHKISILSDLQLDGEIEKQDKFILLLELVYSICPSLSVWVWVSKKKQKSASFKIQLKKKGVRQLNQVSFSNWFVVSFFCWSYVYNLLFFFSSPWDWNQSVLDTNRGRYPSRDFMSRLCWAKRRGRDIFSSQFLYRNNLLHPKALI